MKTFAFGIALFFLSVQGTAQNPPSCTAPTAVQAYYRYDAKQLAIRLMENNPLWQDSVPVPTILYQPILDALLAVYNAKQIPERDTVLQCLDIHAFPLPSPNHLTLAASTQLAWTSNLKNNIFPTGNAQIDALMYEFQLRTADHLTVGQTIYFDIQSHDYLNQQALINRFEAIPDVDYAELQGPIGDGGDIVFERVNGKAELTYSLGWGDCPAGCIFNRAWKFRINADCSVQFVNVVGAALDNSVTCSSSFDCATQALCQQWIQDTLAYYVNTTQSTCMQPNYGLSLHMKPAPYGQSVFILYEVIGSDAENFRFYNCSGDLLGTCAITIAGIYCSNPNLDKYLDGPEIWNCNQDLPTAQNCGTSHAHDHQKKSIDFTIVPNPSKGMAILDFGDVQGRNFHVSILDFQGRLLQEQAASAENHRIETSNLPTGIYLVRVEGSEGVALRKMVVEN